LASNWEQKYWELKMGKISGSHGSYGFYSDLIGDLSGISWNFMEASGLLE
jgi:hypothetical protein